MTQALAERRKVALLLIGLFVAAVSTRPQLVGIGPLLGRIQADLGVSHATAGLLGTIPVLCMGVFAPVGPVVLRRFGPALGVGACIALIAGGGLIRAGTGALAIILAATLVIGIGMGVTGSAMPMVVAELLRDSRAMATGVYVAGIQVGAAISSAVTVPLADAHGGSGGWRWSMGLVSVGTVALLGAWLAIARAAAAGGRAAPAARPAWLGHLRDRRVWLLIAIFSTLAVCYYGLIAWLADGYEERGWTPGAAGALVAVMNLSALPGALVVPWIAERRGTRRSQVGAMAVVYAVALVALAALPAVAWPAAVLVGFANGGLMSLVMVLPVDMARDPGEAGVLAGAMLGAGYTLAAGAPVALGAVRDITHSFEPVLWAVAGSGILLLVLVRRLDRRPQLATAPA
jgi:CP family cyanate transporter-like MFS transporter